MHKAIIIKHMPKYIIDSRIAARKKFTVIIPIEKKKLTNELSSQRKPMSFVEWGRRRD